MSKITLVINYEEGDTVHMASFGDEIAGGKVSAIAIYDVMETMHIAEEALESGNVDECIDASEKIDKIIARSCGHE